MTLSGGMKKRQGNEVVVAIPQSSGCTKTLGAIDQVAVRQHHPFRSRRCSGCVEQFYYVLGEAYYLQLVGGGQLNRSLKLFIKNDFDPTLVNYFCKRLMTLSTCDG